MTQETDKTPAPSDPPAKAPEPQKPKKPGAWRRRILYFMMTVVTVTLLFRVLLSLLLPWTIRRAARLYGLDCTFERSDLYLFSGDAGLWYVHVVDIETRKPIAEVVYCRADISPLQLFHGRLVVQRLEADGAELTVQREADGTIPLLQRLLAGAQKPAPPKPGAKPSELDLTSPVAIDALRLTHLKAHVVDLAVKPALDAHIEMDLRLSDLASPVRPARFNMEVMPTTLVDSLVVEAVGTSGGKVLDATFHVGAHGVHAEPLAGYLSPFGVKPLADGVTMKMGGKITTSGVVNDPQAIAATLKLEDITVVADGKDAVAIKGLTLDARAIRPDSASIGKVTIEGGTVIAEHTAAGGFRAAGFEWTPPITAPPAPVPPASSASRSVPVSTPVPLPASTGAAMLAPVRWNLDEFSLKDFKATLRDDAASPPVKLQFVVDDLALKGIVDDTTLPNAPVELTGRFSAPGIASRLSVDGTLHPFAATKTAQLVVKAGGIRPDAVRPYLDAIGIRSDLKSGNFACQLSADVTLPNPQTITANARLQNVRFDDGVELLAMDDVHVAGLSLSPGSIRVDAVDITGPRAAARRETSGALWAAGFGLIPQGAGPSAASSRVVAPAPSSKVGATSRPAAGPMISDIALMLPKIDIGRLTWSGVQVHLDDAMSVPPTAISIEGAGVELSDIHIDNDPKAPASKPGKIRAWMKAPGLAGDLSLEGTVTQLPEGLVADVEVNGEQLSAILVTPYLKALRIEPTLRNASLHAQAHVEIAQTATELRVSLSAKKVRLSDGGEELLGVDEAAIHGINLEGNSLVVDEIALVRPRGQVIHEEGGAFRAAGFRLLPAPPEVKKSAFAAAPSGPATLPSATSAPATQPAALSGPTTQPVAPDTQPAPAALILVLKKFTIQDGSLAWIDRDVKPVAQITAVAGGSVEGLVWGKASDPAKIAFTFKSPGICQEAKIIGTAIATEDSARASLEISAIGLAQGPLGSYLPPGIAIDLKDGRFHGKLDASVALNPKGGIGGQLVVSQIDYRDGEKGPVLFALDAAKVSVARVDIPAGVIAIDEISAAGAQTSALQDAGGTFHVLGIAQGKPAPAATQPVAAAAPKSAAATQPTVAQTLGAQGTVVDAIPAARVVLAKRKYPLITLRKLDLNLRRLSFTDESRPGVAPLVVSDLRFFANKPIEVLGDDPSSRPALDLALSLRLDDVIDKVDVTTQLAPFAAQPTVTVDIAAAGIHGAGLLAQAPQLKPQIDATALTDGQLRAHVEMQLKLDRIDPLDFNPPGGFDIDLFLLKGLEYRATEKGPLLAGVGEVRSEGVHVQPDKANVLARLVEVNLITGQASREKDGIHALGVILKVPEASPPATQPAVGSTVASSGPGKSKVPATRPAAPVVVVVASAAEPVPAPASSPSASPAKEATGEIRIDKVTVSGLDLRVEDKTVSPSLVIPLNQLDLEVRGISSRALVEDRPIRFSLLVGAGKVSLPKPLEKNSLGGGLKDVASVLGGKKVDTTVVMEQRDLFSQVQADGEISLYPQPKGWVKTSVSAFDLASLKSEVKEFGIDLSAGVFDSTVDAHLPGDGSMQTQSHFTFTDMDLAEPPDGPIFRYLHLPAPLNVVLGALRDAEGGIDVPIAVPVKKGNLATSDVAGAAVGAFGAIVTTAITNAPIKAANAVGDIGASLIPFGGGEKKQKKDEPIILEFSAGDDGISAAGAARLAALLKRMKADPNIEVTLRHELSQGDISRASIRANPSPQECLDLVARLGRRRRDLLARRAQLIGTARGDLASRPPGEAAMTVERLHGVERDLAYTEDALDRVYDLLRPGADRQAGRRARTAALEVAQSRLQTIRAVLAAGGLNAANDRVHLTRPQFNPNEKNGGGNVEITITVKKKKD